MTHSSSLPVFGGVCEEDGSKGFDPVEHNIVGHVTGGQSAQLVPVVPNGQIHKGTFSQSDYGKCVIVVIKWYSDRRTEAQDNCRIVPVPVTVEVTEAVGFVEVVNKVLVTELLGSNVVDENWEERLVVIVGTGSPVTGVPVAGQSVLVSNVGQVPVAEVDSVLHVGHGVHSCGVTEEGIVFVDVSLVDVEQGGQVVVCPNVVEDVVVVDVVVVALGSSTASTTVL